MKLPLLLAFLFIFGLGLAIGRFGMPEWKPSPAQNREETSSSPSAKSSIDVNGDSFPNPSRAEISLMVRDSDPLRQTDSLLAYVRSVPVEGIPEAIREVQKQNGYGKDQALALLIARWTESDPEKVRAAIPSMQDGQARYMMIRDVYLALAAKDPNGAMKLAQELPTQNLRDAAINNVVQQVAQNDPARALVLFQNSKSMYGGSLGAIFSQWADKDLNEATRAAAQLSKTQDRTSALQSIAIRLSQKDTAAAEAWVEQLPSGQALNQARADMVARIANRDPAAAASYVQSLEDAPADSMMGLVQNVAMYWNQTDPKACATWAQKLPLSQQRANALQFSLAAMAKTNPADAVSFLSTLSPSEPGYASVVNGVASTWAQNDPQAALAWASHLPPGNARDFSLSSVIVQWSNAEPQNAANYLLTLPAGQIQQANIGSVVSSWANNDPASAAQWIGRLPDNPQKNDLYGTIAATWAKNSPVDASSWLLQLPTGTSRDNAIRTFASQVVTTDPTGAFQWSQAITNAETRQSQMMEVLRRWQTYDPNAAAAAAAQSNLTPEQKASFQPKPY